MKEPKGTRIDWPQAENTITQGEPADLCNPDLMESWGAHAAARSTAHYWANKSDIRCSERINDPLRMCVVCTNGTPPRSSTSLNRCTGIRPRTTCTQVHAPAGHDIGPSPWQHTGSGHVRELAGGLAHGTDKTGSSLRFVMVEMSKKQPTMMEVS